MSRPKHFGTILKAGLLILVLGFSVFSSAPHASAAASQSQTDALGCDGGKTDGFSYRPANFPDNPDQVDPKQLSVTVGRVTFWFDSMTHQDRGGGTDSWDFVFKPKDATPGLTFVFREDPSADGGFGYVVDGPPGDGLEPDNQVCNLIDFHKTDIGSFLKDQTNATGLKWAKDGGITTDTKSSDLIDRAANDPFTQALQKLAEVITSLIGSIASAIAWALDAGNLMQNDGLTEAWSVVRDLVNLLFILVLLVLGFTSIIRVEPQKYNVRRLLPLLVFSVIAVNFSFLFAGIMANTATVLSQPFLAKAHAFIDHAAGVGSGYSDGLADGFGEAVVLLIASIIILIALIILLFFLVARIIVLWVLAVLSPVVFLFLVLPLTRGEAQNLLKNYIQWVYLAPIAMLLLFSGSLMLASSLQNDTGDPGGSAILQAIFFAGITIAAVMVPIGLGGRIAQTLAKHGSRAGKGGGKAGLGAVGLIPLGSGMTVGEAARTGRGYMKLRKDAQEQRGLERAAGIQTAVHDRLGDSGIAKSLTGRDATQAKTVTEGLVDERLKRLDAIGFQDPDYLQTMKYIMAPAAEQARLAPAMSADQLEQAKSRVGQLATAKALAKNGWWDDKIARRFGHTGYQKFSESDPAMQHLKRKRYAPNHQFTMNDYDTLGFGLTMSSIDGDGMRKIQTPFWDYVNPDSQASKEMPGASDMVRKMMSDQGLEGKRFNYNALRQNVNARHRNNAPDAKRRKHTGNWDYLDKTRFSLARKAILSGVLDSRQDRFMPMGSDGPQTFEEVENIRPPDYERDG